MSINLYSFVEHPFTNKAYFNYDKFKDVVYKAQRLMDDIVDLEEEKINLILNKIENDPEPEEIKSVEKNLWIKIRKKLLEGRRTGLSAIGLADCFAACNIQYANSESLLLAEEIYKQFAISAYRSSIDMANERGVFPIYNYLSEKDNPFINRICEELSEDSNYRRDSHHINNGKRVNTCLRRNIALLTVPPSGTISMFGNKNGISSGIEPVYQLYYKRRRKLEKDNPNITFVDQNGDGWEEYTVLHPKFKEFLKYKDSYDEGFKNLEQEEQIILSPYYESTAYDIDPLQRVKLQATIQKWIDHSISSTINLPKGTTEETVSNLYMEAWKQGCKGLTIYVDECRTGVLVSADKEESEFKQHNAPKRPTILPCDIYVTKSKGKEWLVVIGLLNNKPYEVFTIENTWNTKSTYMVGDIVKVSSGHYDLRIKDDLTIENFTKDIPNDENLLTRIISTALRHGADIKFVVEQLSTSKGDITSFGLATARILKKYIKDEEKSKDKCPECGEAMVYKDGCKSCNSCGYSRCG